MCGPEYAIYLLRRFFRYPQSMPSDSDITRVVAIVTPEEHAEILKRADAGHMTLAAYLRKLLGLPRLPERRGRPKGSVRRKPGRPPKMKQAPLFADVPVAPESSKRASEGAMLAAPPAEDERDAG